MAKTTPMTYAELTSDFMLRQHLKVPLEFVQSRLLKGEQLTMVESELKDPGEDYTRLYLNGDLILEIAGY